MTSKDTIKIFTIGRLSVEINNTPIQKFKTRKAELLFVYLAYHQGEHQRERIANLFWETGSAKQVANNLSKALTHIRQVLPDVVSTTHNTISLAKDAPIWLDVRYIKDCWEQLQNDHLLSYENIKLLEKILTLPSSEFLAGIHFKNSLQLEEWRISQVLIVEQILENMFRALIDYYDKNGQRDRSLLWCKSWLSQNPYSDIAIRTLMNNLDKMGNYSIGIQYYQEFENRLQLDLGVEPQNETKALYEQLKFNDERILEKSPNILPQASTPFVARPHEQALISKWVLNEKLRLLSIVGLGGSGKTRLALDVIYQFMDRFEDIYFVRLNELINFNSILVRIATTLQIQNNATENLLDSVCGFLSHRTVLLVLDNVEPESEVNNIIEKLLDHTNTLKLLITSRQRVGLLREQVLPLKGMRLSNDSSIFNEANELFIQSAKRVNPHFIANKNNIQTIQEICEILGGLPLAIEIVAQWASNLSCAQIKQELMLNHHSIIANDNKLGSIFESVWKQLSSAERHTLMFLSTFSSEFSLDMIMEIAKGNFTIVANLIDRNLLQMLSSEKYGLHPLVVHFSRQQAIHEGFWEQAQLAYINYFKETVPEDPRISPPKEGINIVTALQYAYRQRIYSAQLILLRSYVHYCRHIGMMTEALYWLKKILDQPQEYFDQGEYAGIIILYGRIHWLMGNINKAQEYYEQGLELSIQIENDYQIARAYQSLSSISFMRGDYQHSKEYSTKSIVIYRKIGQHAYVGKILINLGMISYSQGEYEEANQYLLEALELLRLVYNTDECEDIITIFDLLVQFALERGNYEEALSYIQPGWLSARKINHTLLQIHFAGHYTEYYLHKKDFDKALEWCKLGIKEAQTSNFNISLADLYRLKGVVYLDLDKASQAKAFLYKSLSMSVEIQNKHSQLLTIPSIAHAMLQLQKYQECLILVSAFETLKIDSSREHPRIEICRTYLLEYFPKSQFDMLWETGVQMSLDEVIDFVMSNL